MLAADGYLLGTTANFGYMSGALKHFFDTIFLEAGGALADDGSAAAGATGGKKPFGLWVHGRYDTDRRGAVGAEHRAGAAVDAVRRGARGAGRGDRASSARRRTSSAARLAALLAEADDCGGSRQVRFRTVLRSSGGCRAGLRVVPPRRARC